MLAEIKPAALELIHKMIVKSKSNKHETDLRGNPLNSDYARYELKELLKSLSLVILEDVDSAIESELKNILNFIEGVGAEYNHIGYWGSTGTWGVRQSEIFSLMAMNNYKLPEGLEFPQYEKSPYKFEIEYGDDIAIMRVDNIRFDWCLAIFEINPELYTLNDKFCTINGWSDSLLWSSLYYHPDQLPFFMTNYRQHI